MATLGKKGKIKINFPKVNYKNDLLTLEDNTETLPPLNSSKNQML